MSLSQVDKTRGRIIKALQETTEDGWIMVDELSEIFLRMYEKTDRPVYKFGGTMNVKSVMGSINELRAEGLLGEKGDGKIRITGFLLRLESPIIVPPDNTKMLEQFAGEIINR